MLAAADPTMASPSLIEAVKADTGSAIFKLMESYPLTSAADLLIVLWFVTLDEALLTGPPDIEKPDE